MLKSVRVRLPARAQARVHERAGRDGRRAGARERVPGSVAGWVWLCGCVGVCVSVSRRVGVCVCVCVCVLAST